MNLRLVFSALIDFDDIEEDSIDTKTIMPITGFESILKSTTFYRVIFACWDTNEGMKLASYKKNFTLAQFSTYESDVLEGLVDPDSQFFKVDVFELADETQYAYLAEETTKIKSSVFASIDDIDSLKVDLNLSHADSIKLRSFVFESLAKVGKIEFCKMILEKSELPKVGGFIQKKETKCVPETRNGNQTVVKINCQNGSRESIHVNLWNVKSDDVERINEGACFMLYGLEVKHSSYGTRWTCGYGGLSVLGIQEKVFFVVGNV